MARQKGWGKDEQDPYAAANARRSDGAEPMEKRWPRAALLANVVVDANDHEAPDSPSLEANGHALGRRAVEKPAPHGVGDTRADRARWANAVAPGMQSGASMGLAR